MLTIAFDDRHFQQKKKDQQHDVSVSIIQYLATSKY